MKQYYLFKRHLKNKSILIIFRDEILKRLFKDTFIIMWKGGVFERDVVQDPERRLSGEEYCLLFQGT